MQWLKDKAHESLEVYAASERGAEEAFYISLTWAACGLASWYLMVDDA